MENDNAKAPTFSQPTALHDILAAAKQSQRREHQDALNAKVVNRDPTLRQLIAATAVDVERWLKKKQSERNAKGQTARARWAIQSVGESWQASYGGIARAGRGK